MKLATLLFALTSLLLASCTSSKSVVSQKADLSKYEYASIINGVYRHIPPELMEYEIQLFDAVESSNLKLVSDRRLHELTAQQKERLLLVHYGATVRDEETIVTVNFIDYSTGRPVISCRSSYSSIGIEGHDIKGAVKGVAKQISKTFSK